MELALAGVSAAPGIAVGLAAVLDRSLPVAPKAIAQSARERELSRARAALGLTADDLARIALRLREEGARDEAEMVEAGVLMAGDPSLLAEVESLVLGSGMPAAVALRTAAERIAAELAALSDPTLAQRADDVRSIGRRAAAHAGAVRGGPSGDVVVASTLGPADVAELAPKSKAIALAGGGVTAHAAIVARSLGLPMVVGLGSDLLSIEDGEEVVVDGDRGMVVRRPRAERVASAHSDVDRRRRARDLAVSRREQVARTRDGRVVRVFANASTVAELREALAQGAEGIGLLRSELIFLEAPRWPTFEQQVGAMRGVLEMLRGQTATVRLFDFGGDKTPPFLHGTSKRGIELLLDYPDQLREHIHAIVAAAAGSNLRILVPMVTNPAQLREVRDLLAGAALGAMIETPEAAMDATTIAQESDFFSLGTNDLTQLVLGLDREKSKSAPVLDSRVLRLIAATARAGRAAGIPVDVCGEAASDATVLPILIGLGVDELSVAAARVGQVREWVRGLEAARCEEEAERLLD